MPPEFAPALDQFPVVALVMLGAWVVLKWADTRAGAELAREQERSRAVAAARDRQVEWLEGELVRLRSRNTQLQNPLDEARRRADGNNP